MIFLTEKKLKTML